MRKVIGLIPLWDDERESYWMLPGYMKLIEQCGGLPMMLPMTDDEKMLDQALGLCDGLLLTGGHDVSPTLYGQEPLAVCGKPCVMRDRIIHICLDGSQLWLSTKSLGFGVPII